MRLTHQAATPEGKDMTAQTYNLVPLFGDADGYDHEGRDAEGYDRDGFKPGEWGKDVDRDGYNRDGYKPDRWCILRDRDGYDQDGYDEDGYNSDGKDSYGYNSDGYDEDGYNEAGYNEDGYNRDGYDEDGYDEDGEDRYGNLRDYCECEDCSSSGDCEWLRYDNPKFVFHSTLDEQDAAGVDHLDFAIPGVPYYGMEIEMTSYCSESEREIIENAPLVWAKEDGSVEGFEMAVHPMTAAFAAENFPWNIVEKLERNGASVMSRSNGLHIHVSRSGFRNHAHLFSFLKFFYRNEDEVCEIGGRDGAVWGEFSIAAQKDHLSYVKDSKRGHRHHTGRYVAVNLQNSDTVEVRAYASTTSARDLRARFELTVACVEYTRNLTVKQVNDGGWEWSAFRQWVRDNHDSYPALSLAILPGRVLA